MTTTRARQIVLAARPKGKPELSNFRLEETAIPTPAAGHPLLAVQYFSRRPGAFIGRLEGRNFGKLIVRVAA